jgi:hypothetical protein
MSDSRVRCAKLGRIIGVLLLAATLGACSAVRLAYNNMPELAYWWLDGYLDFNGAQSLRVKENLTGLVAWHRANELPRIGAMLQTAEALAPSDVTAQQVCATGDDIRARLLAAAEHVELASAELAIDLSDAQLAQLERKYAKVNAEWQKDWLDRSPAYRQNKRYEQFLKNGEDFYGRLNDAQRDLLRQQVAQAVWNPNMTAALRQQRQQEALELLRRFRARQTPVSDARNAIHVYVRHIVEPPESPYRDYQQAVLQEGCRNVAALHNITTPAQREQAVKRLRAYRDDVRALAENR